MSESHTPSTDRQEDEPDQHHQQHQPPEQPFHSKRRHKKSRKGCINCKARKVKCDEAFPTCRSCYLRKTTCVYQTSASASSEHIAPKDPAFTLERESAASANHSLFNSSSSSSCFSSIKQPSTASPSDHQPQSLLTFDAPEAQPSSHLFMADVAVDVPWSATPLYNSLGMLGPTSFDKVDLRLFWHYMSKASTSFTVDPHYQAPVEETLRTTVVSHAFNSPFLMDNVFALSSLDLQHSEPGFARSRALSYHTRAIEGYRRAVERASPETYPAILANSLFLAVLSSQNFRDPNCKELYIIDWMNVWRGMTVILDLVGFDSMSESGLGAIFFRPSIDIEAATLAIPNHLFFMTSSVPDDDPDKPYTAAYITTLKLLGSLYLHLNNGFGPDLSLRINTWLTFIPRAFIDLCELRRPRALVILAHYAAFVRLVSELWWLQNVGERSIADIANYLSPEWQPLLRVPLAAKDATDRLSIARAILGDPGWVSPVRPKEELDREFAPLREENPVAAATAHLQREQMLDMDLSRRVDDAVNSKIVETMTWDGGCFI